MLRKLLVVPLLAVSLTACGGSDTATNTGSDGEAQSVAPATAVATTTACPAKATKKFAKTRFAADMGLAFGSFYQWIYKPFQAGKFKSGVEGQKTAIVKAGA